LLAHLLQVGAPADQHPVPQLIAAMWPDLVRLQALYLAVKDKAVLETISEVYCAILHAGKTTCRSAIPDLIAACVGMLDGMAEPFALTPLTTTLELHGADPEFQPSFTQLLDNIFLRVRAMVGAAIPFTPEAADLLAGLLHLVFRALIFSSHSLSQTTQFVSMIELVSLIHAVHVSRIVQVGSSRFCG
jgi:hypothetical protein